MTARARTILFLGLKLAVAGALIALLLRNADLSGVLARLRAAAPVYLLLAVAAMSLYFAILGLRWRALARAVGTRLAAGRALALYFEATTFNLVLPGSVGGEVLRVWRTTRLFGGLRGNIAAVLFERLGNIAFLMLLVAGWALLAFVEDPALQAAGGAAIALVVLGAASLLRFALMLFAQFRRIRPAREVWRFGWRVRQRFLAPRVLGPFLLRSLGAYALAALAVWAALSAAAGGAVTAPGATSLLVVALLTLAGTAIPLSVAGTGFREGAMYFALTHFQIPPDVALVAAFFFSVALFAQALPGLFVWFLGSNSAPRAR